MKKKIMILIVALMLCFAICGCDDDSAKADAWLGGAYGTYEWISPDGVHYWIYNGYQRYGIAPRYDNDGKLVIDTQEGEEQ